LPKAWCNYVVGVNKLNDYMMLVLGALSMPLKFLKKHNKRS